MTKNYDLFLSRFKLIHLFIILVLIKFLTIYSIQTKRELPINPYDAFIYIAQSYLNYEDPSRSGKTVQSIRDFTQSTIKEEGSKELDTEMFELSGYLDQHYILYSKIFGLVLKYSSIDNIKLWWIFNYISQLIIFISFFCLMKTYSINKNFYSDKIILIASFFLVLSIPHQISATPMTWGVSFYIISNYFIFYKKNKVINYLGILLNFTSLFFHPGIILIAAIFLMMRGIIFITSKSQKNLIDFLKILIPILPIIFLGPLIELFAIQEYLNSNNIFLMIVENIRLNLIDNFQFNFKRTVVIFSKSYLPMVPFFLKYFFVIIYIYSLFVIFKKNKELFFLNICSLVMIFIGCFYKISISHPGHITYYLIQITAPIALISIFNMYEVFSSKIDKKFSLKKGTSIAIIALLIFIPNSFEYYKMIKIRTNIQNLENITDEIKNFNTENFKDSKNAIIIGDKLTLGIFLSTYTNTNIYLDDKIRPKGRFWTHKQSHDIIGYIGKIQDKEKKIKKIVLVSNQVYTFKNIKLYKDFYILHN